MLVSFAQGRPLGLVTGPGIPGGYTGKGTPGMDTDTGISTHDLTRTRQGRFSLDIGREVPTVPDTSIVHVYISC